jgi:predicted nucleic acid-binding protein
LITFVLDASVAVKWAIPLEEEALTSESVRLLKRYIDGEVDFEVPDIFWAEVANALCTGVCRHRWSSLIAEQIASDIRRRDFPTVPSLMLFSEALQIALTYDRSVYDCLYVALAVQTKTEWITADERLANALAARLPVKWLGAI